MNTVARFQGSGSRPQVNGNREQTNNFILDGVDVNQSVDNQIGYQPNVDALEEVKWSPAMPAPNSATSARQRRDVAQERH
jgi:hypothetical protein